MSTQVFLNISRLTGKDAPDNNIEMWRLVGRVGAESILERHNTQADCHNRAIAILNASKYMEGK